MSLPTEQEQVESALEEIYRGLKGTRREVRGSDRLAEDLGIDSLLGQEIVVALEERYGVELIGRPELLEAKTVDDLVAALASIAAEPEAEPAQPRAVGR